MVNWLIDGQGKRIKGRSRKSSEVEMDSMF
jgi:hypothetical protein